MHTVPAIQMVPIDIATLLDVDERDFARLAAQFENYDLQLFNTNTSMMHPFYVLVNAYKGLEQSRNTTLDAVATVRRDCQLLEPLLWDLEDQTIAGQSGTCIDGTAVQSSVFTYQIANLNAKNVDQLSSSMTRLHSLMYSNLHDITTKCEAWAELVKSRCIDLVNKSATLSKSATSDPVPLMAPNSVHSFEITSLKDHLNILFHFERLTPKTSYISTHEDSSSFSSPQPSKSPDMSEFLKTLHWCITYLIAVLLRNATEDDHHWLLRRLVHTRNITEWGKEFLQVPGLLKSRQGVSLQQRYEGAKYYVSALRRLLCPILDHRLLRLPNDLPPSKSLDFVKSKAGDAVVAQTDDASLFVLTESDFLSMLSQFSLGSFLSAFTQSTLDDVQSQLSSGQGDAMDFVSRAASVLSIFEDLLNVLASSLPLVVFAYVDVGKKLADMLVKVANRALNFVSDLLLYLQLPPPHISSMIKSKAEQLLFRAFVALLKQPALWQFLVHLDLSSASIEVVCCLFSSIYFDNPTLFDTQSLNIVIWKSKIGSTPSMRSVIIERLTTKPTASYLIYALTKMMTTHMGNNDFIRVVLFELFSLAYMIEETSDTMQKHIRDQIAPIISANPTLISLLIELTDTHLVRIGYGCFHPWKGLNLLGYQLPQEDIPTLRRWLISGNPDTSPEHHLAKFIIASISIDCIQQEADLHLGQLSSTPPGQQHPQISPSSSQIQVFQAVAFEPAQISGSPLQRRIAMLIVNTYRDFTSTTPNRPSTHINTFTQYCTSILLRTFHHEYLSLSSYPDDFDQSVVSHLAKTFTSCMPSGYTSSSVRIALGLGTGSSRLAVAADTAAYGQMCNANMDPVTAFGIIELTGLAGASSHNLLHRTVPQLFSSTAGVGESHPHASSSDIDTCVRSFFDCAVPIIGSLLSGNSSNNSQNKLQCLQMGYRLAFDATILVAPFIALMPSFSSPDWSSCPLIATSLATFANYLALPLLQVPSLFGSMSTMIKGSVPSYLLTSSSSSSSLASSSQSSQQVPSSASPSTPPPPPPLINLISAQYSLCRKADAIAGSSSFSGPASPITTTTTTTTSTSSSSSSSLGLNFPSNGWYPNLESYDSEPFGNNRHDVSASSSSALDAYSSSHSVARTSSLLSFWIKSLMLVKDWYTVPQVLDTVEHCFELLHEAGIFQLGIELATQAESFALVPSVSASKRSSVASSTSPGALPKILTTLLGTIATPKGFISSLFSSAAMDQVTHPWITAALFHSFARTQLFGLEEDIGVAVSTTLVPGLPSPMSLSSLKTSLLPLQPYFEALTKSILVIEPAHPSSILYWYLFARLFFSHCSINGQTLFYGFTLFQTSSSKTRKDKIQARINFFVNYFTTSSASSVGSQSVTTSSATSSMAPTSTPTHTISPSSSSQHLNSTTKRIQQTAADEKRLKVQLRELYASMRTWFSIPVHTFNTLPELLATAPMGYWLSHALGKDDLQSAQAFVSLAPQSIPQLEGRVSNFTLYMLQPTKDTVKVEAYMPTTRTTVDLMELLKVFGLERLESIRQLRKDKKAAYQKLHQDDEVEDGSSAANAASGAVSMGDSSVGVPALPDGNRPQFEPFDIASPDFLQKVSDSLQVLRKEADAFQLRRSSHLSLLDRRLQLLQSEKRNQAQIATAKAPCKLGEACKGAVEFKLQISRVVSDLQTQRELQANVDQLFSLVQAITARDTEQVSNAILVRLLRTMYFVFGDSDDSSSSSLSPASPIPLETSPLESLASSSASKIPNVQKFEATLIQLYWLLRDFHFPATTSFSPSLQVFNLLERQLLQKVVVNNALQVGRALYTLVEDPWACVSLKDCWNASSASPMEQFHMLEYLWAQPLPMLPDASRASLLSGFDVVHLFASLGSSDLSKDCINRLLNILKSQLVIRAQASSNRPASTSSSTSSPSTSTSTLPAGQVDFQREIQDILHSLAVSQMAQLAGYNFPSNVGPILQFIFDESRKRTLHPSAWDTVLLLPYARDANAPGLAANKLQSLLTFVSSYMDMFKNLNVTNHLSQWAPYMGKYLVLLKQLGHCLLQHWHQQQEAAEGNKKPAAQISTTIEEGNDEPASTATKSDTTPNKRNAADIEAMAKAFFDLYTMWIVAPGPANIFEAWDVNTIEPIATMVSESLQQIMYYIIVGPLALTVPSTTFARRFKTEVLFNASFSRLFSPHSPHILISVSKYLFSMIKTPSLPNQRAALLERTSFWNLPFSSLLAAPKELYLSLLQTIQELLAQTKNNSHLFRLTYKLAMSMVPEMSLEFQTPFLLSPSLDSDSLGIILDMAFMAITYLSLPYEQDEADFWKAMVPTSSPSLSAASSSSSSSPSDVRLPSKLESLPWSRLAPTKVPSVDDASGPLRDLLSIVKSSCQKRNIYFAGASGYDVSRPGSVRTSGDSDRAFQALWLLRAFAHLSSSHDPVNLPFVISMPGLTAMRFAPSVNEWKDADECIRGALIVSRVFASQSVLLAYTSNLDDTQLWWNPPYVLGGVLGPMLHFGLELSNVLYTLSSSSSAPPISPEARRYLQQTCELPSHIPDAIAYPVLWSHLLTKILANILSLFNHLESASNSRSNLPGSSSSKTLASSSSKASMTATIPNESLFARLVDCTVQLVRHQPGITTLFVPVALNTITSLAVLARLVEALLEVDWNASKSISRLSEALVLPPSINAPLFRQSLFSINGIISFTAMQHQLLQKEEIPALLQFEPEMRHWCAAALLLPGREHFALGMWYKAIQLYILLLRSNVQQVATLTGNSAKSSGNLAKSSGKLYDFLEQLFKIAQNIFTKTDSKITSDSALMRFIGVKKASPLTANFRIAAQLVSVFLFEHLLETPILGPGNKVVGSIIAVRNHAAFNVVDEGQEKRKQVLIESTKRPPNTEFSATITTCIQFISRPQKSLNDVDEVWKMVVQMFPTNVAELLSSLAP